MSLPVERDVPASRWTERETELLQVALRLLQERGYDRLTMAAVATEAKASKATMYRRWPSKAQLVLTVIVEGTRIKAVSPLSGSLRGDLLQVGALLSEHARQHACTVRAVSTEMSHFPALADALHHQLVHQHKMLMTQVLTEAASRGDIDAGVISEEICDVLPGYLLYRFLVPGPPPTADTVRKLVDDVLMPSLTRRSKARSSLPV